nr:transposase [Streptococcus criceti]
MNERYQTQTLKQKESQALLSEKGRRIFAKRKADVEPVFGQIKACLGYKRCNLRSKSQVTIDMGSVLMANNLRNTTQEELKSKKQSTSSKGTLLFDDLSTFVSGFFLAFLSEKIGWKP